MAIIERLLHGQSFITLLKEFAIDAADVKIQDEEVIFSSNRHVNAEVLKENICIEARNKEGIIDFFGTLHYNLLNELAIFELQGFEQRPLLVV